jgi:hypothetical protein
MHLECSIRYMLLQRRWPSRWPVGSSRWQCSACWCTAFRRVYLIQPQRYVMYADDRSEYYSSFRPSVHSTPLKTPGLSVHTTVEWSTQLFQCAYLSSMRTRGLFPMPGARSARRATTAEVCARHCLELGRHTSRVTSIAPHDWLQMLSHCAPHSF